MFGYYSVTPLRPLSVLKQVKLKSNVATVATNAPDVEANSLSKKSGGNGPLLADSGGNQRLLAKKDALAAAKIISLFVAGIFSNRLLGVHPPFFSCWLVPTLARKFAEHSSYAK